MKIKKIIHYTTEIESQKYKISFMLFIIFISLSITSCSNDITDEIKVLSKENETLNDRIQFLENQIEEYENNEHEQNEQYNQSIYKWIYDEKFSWLNNKEWNKVILKNSRTEETLDITENILIKNVIPQVMFGYLKEKPSDRNMGPVHYYTYEFHLDSKIHILQIEDDFAPYMILDGETFEYSGKLYALGETFLPTIPLNEDNEIFINLQNCRLITTNYAGQENDIHACAQKWRIKLIAEHLYFGMKRIENLPEENMEADEFIDFYSDGQIIKLNIYDYGGEGARFAEILYEDNMIIFENIDRDATLYHVLGAN